jgi:hypothetical protein
MINNQVSKFRNNGLPASRVREGGGRQPLTAETDPESSGTSAASLWKIFWARRRLIAEWGLVCSAVEFLTSFAQCPLYRATICRAPLYRRKKCVVEAKLTQLQAELLQAQADRIRRQSTYELAEKTTPEGLAELTESGPIREYEFKLNDARQQLATAQFLYTPNQEREHGFRDACRQRGGVRSRGSADSSV